MNKGAPAFVEALARQGIACDITETKVAGDLAAIRLRFDRVALRFVRDVGIAVQDAVPDGRTLVFTITAPIWLASKTAAALEEKVRSYLSRRSARIALDETINGNRIGARLVKGGAKGSPNAIGFVHNPDCDPGILFRAMQSLLRRG